MLAKSPPSFDPWETIERSAEYTDDWMKLKKSPMEEFLVFVVGHLRKNRKLNNLLNGCSYYGQGRTWSDNFLMRRANNNLMSEPMVFEFPEKGREELERRYMEFNMNYLGKIEGDVYGVPLRVLAKLDAYEGNGHCTKREQRYVNFQHSLQSGKSAKAFMYTMDFDFYDNYHFSGGYLLTCPSTTYGGYRTYHFTT